MIDEAFAVRAIDYVERSHFTTQPLGWVWSVFEKHWEEYRMRCTDIPLRDALRKISPEKYALYAPEVDAIVALGTVPESDFVKGQLRDWCQRNVFAEAHQEAARLFNDDKQIEAYDVMARAQDRIQQIDFNTVDRQWFFAGLADRQRDRHRRTIDPNAGVFTTGIRQLDDSTDGGVHLGELWVVFAYAKRCKSMWLVNQGFHATRVHRRPTLHVVLEGHGAQIAARYDACFSQELYSNVKRGEIDPRLFSSMHAEYEQLRGLLVIRTLNDWDVNVQHISAELDDLRATGFVPEMLVVDYMDLLRSRSRTDSETQHQLNAARDLKRLINRHEIACWSAWQAQRPRQGAHTKEHVLTSGNVADAYAKVRVVDAYGSLNATDDEMSRGEMRLYMEGHRDAPVNRLYLLQNDLSRMRMMTSVSERAASAS